MSEGMDLLLPFLFLTIMFAMVFYQIFNMVKSIIVLITLTIKAIFKLRHFHLDGTPRIKILNDRLIIADQVYTHHSIDDLKWLINSLEATMEDHSNKFERIKKVFISMESVPIKWPLLNYYQLYKTHSEILAASKYYNWASNVA